MMETETITRREAMVALAAYLGLANATGAQSQASASPVFSQDLPNLTMDGWEVTASHVDYPPGYSGNPHRHPGFTLVYVVQGTVVAKVSGTEERTFAAGQMFFEQPGSVHEVSRNGSVTQPAKLLALIFAKKGLPKTAPA
jgi:quercetin dioxygenase-like cupin family protein